MTDPYTNCTYPECRCFEYDECVAMVPTQEERINIASGEDVVLELEEEHS